MVVLAQRPLPVRPPGTQTSAGAGGNKIATWRMWTPRLPGLPDEAESGGQEYKRWFESGTLLIKEFQQGDHSVISLAALAAAALAALAFALGGILLKREPWDLSSAPCRTRKVPFLKLEPTLSAFP